MILIAHRGNTNGPMPTEENSPSYIEKAIVNGYDAEVDMWAMNGQLFLGHDNPQYKISKDFFIDLENSLWIHCKNDEAVDFCFDNQLHFFYHNIDRYTMTSHGFVWGYPDSTPVATSKFIIVLPELTDNDIRNDVYGICSDYVKGFMYV